jgi:predicted Na+-dependent transporter
MTIIVMAAIVEAGATAVIATVVLTLVAIVVVPALGEGFAHGGRQHQDGGGSGEKLFHWGTFLFVPFTSTKIGFPP